MLGGLPECASGGLAPIDDDFGFFGGDQFVSYVDLGGGVGADGDADGAGGGDAFVLAGAPVGDAFGVDAPSFGAGALPLWMLISPRMSRMVAPFTSASTSSPCFLVFGSLGLIDGSWYMVILFHSIAAVGKVCKGRGTFRSLQSRDVPKLIGPPAS